MQDPTVSLVLQSWSWNPAIIISLIVIAGIYAYGFYYFKRRGWLKALLEEGLVKRSQPVYFVLGLIAIVVALLSPIDTMSSLLFTMHMTQHILLIMVAPPLLLLGLPEAFVRPFIQKRLIKTVLQGITHPFVAFIVFNVTLVVWHLPALYDAALQNDFLHDLEHAMFFYTSVLSWWPMLSPTRELPRLSYPSQILYIFLIAIPSGVLGAVLVFVKQVLYPTYETVPRVWNLTALADQQLGGLIMMVPGKAIYLIALTIVFFIWFNKDEPAQQGQLI
jgi:cytochrome c oxidase assembly factor CtaG